MSSRPSHKKDKHRSNRRSGSDRKESYDTTIPSNKASQYNDKAEREGYGEGQYGSYPDERGYMAPQPTQYSTRVNSTTPSPHALNQDSPARATSYQPYSISTLQDGVENLSIEPSGGYQSSPEGYYSRDHYGQQSPEQSAQATTYNTRSYESTTYSSPGAGYNVEAPPYSIAPQHSTASTYSAEGDYYSSARSTYASEQPSYNVATPIVPTMPPESYQVPYSTMQGHPTSVGVYSTDPLGYGTPSTPWEETSCQCDLSPDGDHKCKDTNTAQQVSKSSKASKSRPSKVSTSRQSKSLPRTESKMGPGTGCFVIDLPVNITPKPPPVDPGPDASNDRMKRFEREFQIWDEEREQWQEATCSCRYGYFNEMGRWVSGAAVRSGKELPNPRWPNGKRSY